MHGPTCDSCSCARLPPRTWLLQMRTDAFGMSALASLPVGGRLWAVLGSEGPNGYTVQVVWGSYVVEVDNAPAGLHMQTPLPCFPDAFVRVTGQPNTLYLISVTE